MEFTGGIYTGWNLLACLESFFQMRKLNPLSYAIISHYNFQTLYNNFFKFFKVYYSNHYAKCERSQRLMNQPPQGVYQFVCMH